MINFTCLASLAAGKTYLFDFTIKTCFEELNYLSLITEMVYPFTFKYLSEAVIVTLKLSGL